MRVKARGENGLGARALIPLHVVAFVVQVLDLSFVEDSRDAF